MTDCLTFLFKKKKKKAVTKTKVEKFIPDHSSSSDLVITHKRSTKATKATSVAHHQPVGVPDHHPTEVIPIIPTHYKRNMCTNFDTKVEAYYSLSESSMSESILSMSTDKFGEVREIGIQAGSPLYETGIPMVPAKKTETMLSRMIVKKTLNSAVKSMKTEKDQVHQRRKSDGLRPLIKVPAREKTEKILQPLGVKTCSNLPPVDKTFLLKLERENVVSTDQENESIKTALAKSQTMFHMNINKTEGAASNDDGWRTSDVGSDEQLSEEDLLLREVDNLLHTLPVTKKATNSVKPKQKQPVVEIRKVDARIVNKPPDPPAKVVEKTDGYYDADEMALMESIEKEFSKGIAV